MKRKILSVILAVCLILTLIPTTSFASVNPIQREFYISPDGNDENPGTESQPFRTFEKARNEIRLINSNMTGEIVVYAMGGTYNFESTLEFGPEDSGTNGFNIIYKNYTGQTPILSGGKAITGWTLSDAEKGIWEATATGIETRQLYVNGTRAIRARSEGGLAGAVKTDTGYTTTDTNIQSWENISDIEFVYNVLWTQSRVGVASISGTAVTMKQPAFEMNHNKTGSMLTAPNVPTYIENAYELLDQQGEWYLNRSTHKIYYKPQSGEDMSTATVIAPVLETLIRGTGTTTDPICNIEFMGLTFSYATWLRPNEDTGFAEIQATVCRNENPSRDMVQTPGNIQFTYAKDIKFERNTFTRLGAAALQFGLGSQNNIISGNIIHDVSSTGIQVGGVGIEDHHPTNREAMTVKNNNITNNYIFNIGAEYKGAVAIFVGYAEATLIANNELTKLPYTGISIGWGWGTVDSIANPTTSKNNTIRNNYIHDIMNTLIDGGGIYSLGAQPGMLITENVVSDMHNLHGSIYLDDASRYVTVRENIMYNNIMNMLVKGSDHTVINNYWDKVKNMNAINNNIYSNNNVTAIQDFPVNILKNAGLEHEYWDISPHTSLLNNSWPEPDENGESTKEWTAPARGYVKISDSISVLNGAEGVTARVYKNDSVVAGPISIESTGTTCSLYQKVLKGDKLRFVVNDNVNIGWNPLVNFSPVAAACSITRFTLPGQTTDAQIDEIENEISISVADEVDITNLTPSAIEISEDCIISPSAIVARNFSEPVSYTVEDNKGELSKNWTVKVVKAPSVSGTRGYNINNAIGDGANWITDGASAKNVTEGSITISGGSAAYAGEKFQNELLEFEMKSVDAGGAEWPGVTIRQKFAEKAIWDPANEGYILIFKSDSVELQRFNAGVRTVFYGDIPGFEAINGKLTNNVFVMGNNHRVQFGAMNLAEGVRLIVNVDGKKVIDCMDTTENRITSEGYTAVYAYGAPVTLRCVPVVRSINDVIGDGANWITDGTSVKNFTEGSITISGGSAAYAGEKFQNELLEFEMKSVDAGGAEWPGVTIRQKFAEKAIWDPANEGYILIFKSDSVELQKFNAGARTVFYGDIPGFDAINGKLSNYLFVMGNKHRVQFGAMNLAEGVRLVVNVDGKNVIDCMDSTENRITTEGFTAVYAYSAPVTLSNVFITSQETNGAFKGDLNIAIRNARNILDNSVIGLNWGQYAQNTVDELEGVLANAIEIAADENATQEAVDVMTAALNNAKTNFEQNQIIPQVEMGIPVFTDGNGTQVTVLVPNETINVTASINNNKSQSTSAVMIVALYNAQNNIVKYKSTSKVITADASEEFSAAIDMPEDVTGLHLEVFTWDNLNKVEPQSRAYRLPYLPPQSDNMKVWLKADTGVTLVDNKVSVWENQSGSNTTEVKYDFTQATEAYRPQFITSADGGKPTIRFDGINDNLINRTIAGRMNQFTVAWTIKPANLENYNQQMGAFSSGWTAFNMHSAENGALYIGTHTDSRITAVAGTMQVGVIQQFTFTYDGVNGSLYKNGILISSQPMKLPTSDWTGFFIGNGSVGAICGDMAEIMIYNTALTNFERQNIEEYLKNKYGY